MMCANIAVLAALPVVFAIFSALVLDPAMAEEPTAIGKYRLKPVGKHSVLAEVTHFTCPKELRTARGRSAKQAELQRAYRGTACKWIKDRGRVVTMKVVYCRGDTILSWTVRRKDCGI